MKLKAMLLWAMLAVLCMLPAHAQAESETYLSGIYHYTVLEDGTAMIVSCSDVGEELILPVSLDGYTVTVLEEEAFWGNEQLRRVVIPDSLLTIRPECFNACPALCEFVVSEDHPTLMARDGVLFDKQGKTLLVYPGGLGHAEYAVPDGVEVIAESAFYENLSLLGLSLPDSLTQIGPYAFSGCQSLSVIDLPAGLQSIGDGAFYDCGMREMVLPDDLKQLGGSVFWHCQRLRSVSLPAGLEVIADDPFAFCPALTELSVSHEHPALVIENGALIDRQEGRLIHLIADEAVTRYETPAQLNSIGTCACANNEYLKEVVITEGVTEIGTSAFDMCLNLETVSLPAGLKVVGDSAFALCALTEVTIPDGTEALKRGSFYGCNQLTRLVIPASVQEIGKFALSGLPANAIVETAKGSFAAEHAVRLVLAVQYPE